MASWKDKLSFLQPKPVTHMVGDQELQFWPVSVGMAFKLNLVAKPLAKALATLFADTSKDSGESMVNTPTSERHEGKALYVMATTREPTAPMVIEIRNRLRTNAIEDLIDSLSQPANRAIMGELIMDSLRDVFPPDDAQRPNGMEVLDRWTLPTIPQLLGGFAKANKDVLGPLAEGLGMKLAQSLGGKGTPASAEESRAAETN